MSDLSPIFNGHRDAMIWPQDNPLRPAGVREHSSCDGPVNRVDATSQRREIDPSPVSYRTRRLFAGSCVLLLVLVAFAVTSRETRANTVQPLASQSTTYGPGIAITPLGNKTRV